MPGFYYIQVVDRIKMVDNTNGVGKELDFRRSGWCLFEEILYVLK